jgi:hypothetical protein
MTKPVVQSNIDLRMLKDILEQLTTLGISEAIIEPVTLDGKDHTQVRAGNKDHSILIFDQVEGKLSEKAMAISSTKGLQSRLALFNEDKASVTVSNGSTFVSSIEIKEGKRKATYTMSHPNIILAPKVMPEYEIYGDVIEFSKDFIDYLTEVFNSISFTGKRENRRISIKSGNGELIVTVSDGESDSFVETFPSDVSESDIPTTQWDLESFKLALKRSSECDVDKKVSFFITNIGTAVLTAQPLSVIVAPVH